MWELRWLVVLSAAQPYTMCVVLLHCIMLTSNTNMKTSGGLKMQRCELQRDSRRGQLVQQSMHRKVARTDGVRGVYVLAGTYATEASDQRTKVKAMVVPSETVYHGHCLH